MEAYAAFALLLVALPTIAAYRLQKRLDEREGEEPRIHVERPHVVPKFFTWGTVAPVVGPVEDQEPGSNVEIAAVDVANRARRSTERGHAKGVTGQAWFYDVAGREKTSAFGRWADKRPPDDPRQAPHKELREIDIPPDGRIFALDLALQHPGDDDAYAYSDESYGADRLRYPLFRLPPGKYQVRLKVRGTGFEAVETDYTLINPGSSGRLELVTSDHVAAP